MSRRKVVQRAGVSQRPTWKPDTGPRIRSQSRSTDDVHVATDLEALANRETELAADAIVRAVDVHILPVFEQAQRDCPQPSNSPHATGRSITSLGLEFQSKGEFFLVAIVVKAFYAGFIQQARFRKNRRPKRRVIFDPGEKVTLAMAKDVADVLAEGL